MRDIALCVANCGNMECSRNQNIEANKDAICDSHQVWGDFSPSCYGYVELKEETGE